MKIWVDADACPQVIKEILYRAAERTQILTTLVANTPLRTPPSDFIRTVRVARGFDVADHRIVQQAEPVDLVITADIPLAAAIIARGAHALDPRGEWYSEDNVRECRSYARPARSSPAPRRSVRASAASSPITSTAADPPSAPVDRDAATGSPEDDAHPVDGAVARERDAPSRDGPGYPVDLDA
jgi:uncharacterized protein YaiI (UPF0178 family)